MAPRSEWIRLPGEPQGLWRWVFSAFVEEIPRVALTTLAALAAVGLIVFAIASLESADFSFAGDLGGSWSFPRRRRRAPAGLALLAPLPCRDAWYPVSIQVSRDGLRLGSDRAMAVFYDGWLHVEGRRTTFSVRNVDALPNDANGCTILLPEGAQAEIVPYDRIGARRRLAQEFAEAINRWRRAASPEGQPTFPPSRVHPQARGRVVAAVLHGLLLLALAPVALLVHAPGAWVVASVVGLCGVWRAARGGVDWARLRAIAG